MVGSGVESEVMIKGTVECQGMVKCESMAESSSRVWM